MCLSHLHSNGRTDFRNMNHLLNCIRKLPTHHLCTYEGQSYSRQTWDSPRSSWQTSAHPAEENTDFRDIQHKSLCRCLHRGRTSSPSHESATTNQITSTHCFSYHCAVYRQNTVIACCQSDDGFASSLLSVLYGSYHLSYSDVTEIHAECLQGISRVIFCKYGSDHRSELAKCD